MLRLNTQKLRRKEFWGLQDVSLQVQDGERIGLLGLNGSGKSSLLRIIGGGILPTKGSVHTVGEIRIQQIMAGFIPVLTGKEFVYMSGALQGMSKEQIQSVYAEIVEMSESAEYINAPMLSYSTGMRSRLGASVAIHSTADILLLDEIGLGGDARFRERCAKELLFSSQKAKTFVVVSHHVGFVEEVASRIIVLDMGKIVYDGEPAQAAACYKQLCEKT